jgi:hypothetical protein
MLRATSNWLTDTQCFRLPDKGDGNSALVSCPKVNLGYSPVQGAARGTRSLRRTSHAEEGRGSYRQRKVHLEKDFSLARDVSGLRLTRPRPPLGCRSLNKEQTATRSH